MRKRSTSKKSQTDWKRIDAMKDEDIDLSDNPEATPEMFARAVLRRNFKVIPRKKQLTLRIDSDVVDWYKLQGRGYQTRINSLLRAYMKEHQRHVSGRPGTQKSKSI
ncbi:MAG TPA: BrnA antitoxin family protein [Pyrinomonadaceae bacterium]